AVIEGLAGDEMLRAVVVTGAGDRAFIGGADIDEMAELDAASARVFIIRLHRCCDGLRKLPVPVIGRIQGYALGAGLEIAASCDRGGICRWALLSKPGSARSWPPGIPMSRAAS